MYNSLYLKPSEYFITNENYKIVTVLGSCVSVFLYDNYTKYSAVNHFMLPICKDSVNPSAKYGDVAMDISVRSLMYRGSKLSNIKAKIIGGASTLQKGVSGNYKVGQKNIDFAIQFLNNIDVPITGLNIGGNNGRRVIFNTHNFDVLVKQIKETNYEELMKSFE